MEINILDKINEYFCKANNKIAEISTIAADMLEKKGCSCDISEHIDKILDINTSIYYLDKSYDDTENIFGYKHYMIHGEGDASEIKILSIIDRHVIKYDMNDASIIYYPLYSLQMCGCLYPVLPENDYYTRDQSNARFYPRFENPNGYLTEASIDNVVNTIYVLSSNLSGEGSIESQLFNYINSNVNIPYGLGYSKVNIILISNEEAEGFPYTFPLTLS